MGASVHPAVIAWTSAYLVLVLAIGAWALRRTRSARDFFIAGQSLGLVVVGLATMSSAFSGFVFLGGPGLTYRVGIRSLFIVLPLGFTAGLLCWVVGERLRDMAGRQEVFTVPDAFRLRYGSRAVAGLAALTVVLGTVGYLGLQFRVLGILVRTVFGVESLALAMAIGVLVVVAYSTAGGMVAGAYTDVLQGVLMLFAAVAVFTRAIGAAGGWRELVDSVAAAPSFGPAFVEPFGGVPWTAAFGFFFVFGVGVLGQPHMLHKFYMVRDARVLRFLPLVLGGSQAVCVLLWLGVGLAVPALVAQGRMAPLVNPDEATPTFLLSFVPEMLAGLAFAGALAAIMSTADSFVNIGSAALVRDLPRALGRGADGNELRRARLATVALSLVAAVFAWVWDDLVALVGTFAFGTFAAGLAPALAIGFHWKRVGAAAAGASIATGTTLNLGLEFLAKQTWFPGLPRPVLAAGLPPSAVALLASFAVLLFWAWLNPPRPTEPAPAGPPSAAPGRDGPSSPRTA